jgi:hypothetical protein
MDTVGLLAVNRYDAGMAMLEERGRFMGAIPIGRLLALLLHKEHVHDTVRRGGLVAFHPAPPETEGSGQIVHVCVPWLLSGLAGGFLAGGSASLFEAPLKDTIHPGFLSAASRVYGRRRRDSNRNDLPPCVGLGKVPLGTHLLREGTVGLLIGGLGAVHGSLAARLGRDEIGRLHTCGRLALTAMIATFVACL